MKTLFITIIALLLVAIVSVQAQEHEQRAIQEYDAGNYHTAASNYNNAANAYIKSGNTVKATKMFEKAGSLFEQYAIQKYNRKDYGGAVLYYKDAANAYSQAGNTYKAMKMKTIMFMNRLYINLKDRFIYYSPLIVVVIVVAIKYFIF